MTALHALLRAAREWRTVASEDGHVWTAADAGVKARERQLAMIALHRAASAPELDAEVAAIREACVEMCSTGCDAEHRPCPACRILAALGEDPQT